MLFSCNKSEEDLNPILESKGSIKVVNLKTTNKNDIVMLEFSSSQLFNQTMDLLKSQIEEFDSVFLAEYGYLDDSLLNVKEDEIGHDEWKPIDDFVNYYGFSNSMKDAFERAEQEWLDNVYLDTINHPHLKFNFSIEEMALLNADGEVKIGDSILKLTQNGFVYITDGDVSKLIRVRDEDWTVLNDPNVISNIDQNKGTCSSCSGWRSFSDWDYYDNDKKKVYKNITFHNYPWYVRSTTKIVSYKKKWNGNWKRYRRLLGAVNQVYQWPSDCSGSPNSYYSGWKYKTRKSYSRSNTTWGAWLNYTTKPGYCYGGYYYAGNYKYLVLMW